MICDARTDERMRQAEHRAQYSSTTVNWTYGQPDTTDIHTWILRDSA